MKKHYAVLIFALTALLCSINAKAQEADVDTDDTTDMEDVVVLKPKKFYTGNSLDAAIFSTSLFTRPLQAEELTTLRFTYVINFGFNFNFDASKHFGLFTGIGIKNIGFIEKFRTIDSTVKRRVYTVGIPLGIKFGNLQKRNFGFIGGGADLAFNYREKGFVRRGKKEKFNEWFSERTELIMPYVFVGASFNPGITVKAQYYPQNMMNTNYKEQVSGVTVVPYAGYNANLILLSFGMDIHYNKKPKEEIKRMKRSM